MRFALIAFALALAACTQQPKGRCDIEVTRDLTFSGMNAADVVTTSAHGASCDKVILLFTVHDAEGVPLWSWTAPLVHAFGDTIDTSDDKPLREFLERWAAPKLFTTAQAPAWEQLQAGQTTLDKLTYEDIRARNLPMLCHLSGTARETCVFFEPAAGGAGHLLDRDVEELP